MKNFLLILLITMVFNPILAKASDINQLAWLGGCWKSEKENVSSVEHWLPLEGSTLLGVSRTVKQGKTTFYEFMQIREQSDGKLAYIVEPSGQQLTVFPLLSINDQDQKKEAIFENLQHDFPQRIVYATDGSKLNARIEGVINDELRVIPFTKYRVSCDASFKKVGKK